MILRSLLTVASPYRMHVGLLHAYQPDRMHINYSIPSCVCLRIAMPLCCASMYASARITQLASRPILPSRTDWHNAGEQHLPAAPRGPSGKNRDDVTGCSCKHACIHDDACTSYLLLLHGTPPSCSVHEAVCMRQCA